MIFIDPVFLMQIGALTTQNVMVDRLSPWANYVCAPPKEEGVAYQHHFWNPLPEEVCSFLEID